MDLLPYIVGFFVGLLLDYFNVWWWIAISKNNAIQTSFTSMAYYSCLLITAVLTVDEHTVGIAAVLGHGVGSYLATRQKAKHHKGETNAP